MGKLRNRKVLLASGFAAIVLSLAAVGLGSANADSLPGTGQDASGAVGAGSNAAGSQVVNNASVRQAARALLEASDEAMDAGQTVARACRGADTLAGQQAAAAGEQAAAAGMSAKAVARDLLAASRGNSPILAADAEAAFSAAQGAMQTARDAVASAQAAVAANPNARRGAGNMLNSAVRGLDDGAAEMASARASLTNATTR